MSRNHLWAWVGVVCVVCAAAVDAQQDQTTGDASAGTSSATVAAVPRLIKFSGAVRDARGEPLGNIAVRLTFAVYSEQQGGVALWAEPQVAQLDEQGHYTVLLGATRADGLPVELFPAGKARWLGVQVEGRDEDLRVLLVSVPYALKAEDAAMLGGRRASDFVLGEQLKEEVRTQVAAQTPGIATQAVEMLVSNPPKAPAIAEGPSTFTCAMIGDCVTVTQYGAGRALRATATSVSEVVLLQQNGTGYGLRALALGNVALYGQITGSAGTSYGVKGQTTSTTGAGVYGYNLATTGLAYGVLGQTTSPQGTALFGRATATTGATIGLRGHADSTSGTGIVGQATATSGTTTGIVGRVFSAAGTAMIVDNTQGGKLLSGKVGSLEKFSVDGGGNVYATGVWTGSRGVLTVATGTPPLTVNSTTLVLNLNADMLDGVHAGSLATLGTNLFVGNQTVTGNLSLTGAISSNGLRTEPTSGAPNIIGGFGGNSITSGVVSATISGGGDVVNPNRITDNAGTIGGGAGNQAGDDAGTLDDACCSTVGGGIFNKAAGGGSTIGGGYNNVTGGWGATVAGGDGNTASNAHATVGGGVGNKATEWADTVAGGASNTASGVTSTVSGGSENVANDWGGTVPGGLYNTAGMLSFAAGYRAKAIDGGSFVWGDWTEADVTSLGAGSFVVRATGGAFFSNNLTAGGIVSAPAFLGDGSGLTGVPRLVGGNSFTSTQTISTGDLSVSSGDISLPQTASASAGVINLGGTPFIHAYGTANTFVGANAGNFTTTGGWNTASGSSTLYSNTTGYFNSASGAAALYSNTTGSQNTASGTNALVSNTTGYLNTASGVYAMSDNTTGHSNTASGYAALASNTTGNFNTASGDWALVGNTEGNNNSASGHQALYNNTGNDNTASGSQALYSNTTGQNNTALGYRSGLNNSTGSNNTFIGASAGPDSGHGDLTNATAIGANALVSASNALVLGGTGGDAVNVGIGTAAPAHTLDVVGNGNFSGNVTAGSFVGALSGIASDLNCTGCVSPPELTFDPATQTELDTESTARAAADTTLETAVDGRVLKSGDTMAGTLNLPANGLVAGTNQLVLSGGNVGIGTASPGATLEVAGKIKSQNTRSVATATDVVSITTDTWTDMSGMSLSISTGASPVLILVNLTGTWHDTSGEVGRFRLVIDDIPKDLVVVKYASADYECVPLMHLETLSAGDHTVKVQWRTSSGTLRASQDSSVRSLVAAEL